jgi:hypothetical protein
VKVNLGGSDRRPNTGTAVPSSDTLLNFENVTGSNFNDKSHRHQSATTSSMVAVVAWTPSRMSTFVAASGLSPIGVIVNLSLTTAQNTGASGFDTLLGIENLTGSSLVDTLTGNAGDNRPQRRGRRRPHDRRRRKRHLHGG